MKRLLLTAFVLATGFANAQLYSEGFESGFPGSMIQQQLAGSVAWQGGCTGNNGGATCPISGTTSASFFVDAYTQTIAGLSTPVLNLSSGSYLLRFKHIQRVWAGQGFSDVNFLVVRLTNDNGTTWQTLANYTEGVQNATERTINLSFFTTSSTSVIQFVAINNWGYSLILDDIEVVQNTTQNDMALINIDFESIEVMAEKTIAGTFRNVGANVVNSLDLKWQVGEGTIYTQSLSGLNLSSGQSYDFEHDDTWNATPGDYSLKVWVDNINGQTDANPADNQIVHPIRIATGSTDFRPLYEKFTSSTCGPCAAFNGSVFNSHYANNSQNIALINYQVNWPGNGDPYYTAEVGNRVQFYGVNAAPTLKLNGRNGATGATTIGPELTAEIAKPAFFGIEATATINTGTSVEVNYTITPYLSGNYRVYAVVIEKTTTGNVATNGETSFKNVMMKMVPNASGTLHNFEAGTQVTNTVTASMSGTNVEEWTDLEIVVFVQDPTSKEVFQSAYSTNVLSGDSFVKESTFQLYPNPTNGMVNIATEENMTVTVTDITGKVVLTSKLTTGNSQIDLSGFQKGIYMARFSGATIDRTEKIILK